MPPDSSPPSAPPPVPPPRPPREPVPGWMWLLFILGPVVLGMVFGASTASRLGDALSNVMGGGLCGLIFALPFVGGLGLSGRFFTTPAGRIGGGILFAGLLMVGLGAVVFAGCMCLFNGMNMH